MGDVVQLVDPYNKRRAIERIKKLWREGDFVIVSHAKKAMEEDDLSISDVDNVIHYGSITEITPNRQNWRYRIEGPCIEHLRTACIVELDGKAILVTVFRLQRVRRR